MMKYNHHFVAFILSSSVVGLDPLFGRRAWKELHYNRCRCSHITMNTKVIKECVVLIITNLIELEISIILKVLMAANIFVDAILQKCVTSIC